jgi:hypothetical protein
MLRKTLVHLSAAILLAVTLSSSVQAWGAYHVGYTHYSPDTGLHHYGYTDAYRGYGADRYGAYGYHYGGYHYGAYGAYGARYGYYRRW